MTLTDVASIASILSSLAVATSLVFLALQVRQADRNQRSAIIQARSAMGLDAMFHMAEPHNAAIAAKVASDPQNITAQELIQYTSSQRALWIWYEDAFVQHKASLIDRVAFDDVMRGMRGTLRLPNGRVFWKMFGKGFSPDFVAFVNDAIESIPLMPRPDLLANWKKEMGDIEAGLRAEASKGPSPT